MDIILGGKRLRPEQVRGECPACGGPLVSNCYYVGGKGYLVTWDCVNSLKEFADPITCHYRKVL